MQILSIHLKNIKSHRELDLVFSPGINVLSGANGVGKSTIFEAIGYAMFGVDARDFVGNIDRFVTIGARKGEIAVVFTIDDERYRVSRTVGTPAKWLLAREVGGDFEVEEHKDIRETEARLKELLGLEGGRPLAEQFELVIGPFQNEFLGPFVEKRPTARRNKFDEILGIDSWRKTFSDTNALLKAIQNKVEVLEGSIGPLQDQVEKLPGKRDEQKAAKKELTATEDNYKKQQKELKELELRLTDIDKRELRVKDLGFEIDKLKERIGNGKEKVGSQKALISEAEKAKQIVAENAAGKEAYEQAEKRLHELREQVKIQRQLEKELADLNATVSRLAAQYQAEEKAIEQAGKDLTAEEKTLTEKRTSLAVDEAVTKLATRLPEIRETLSKTRTQLGQLDGRRVGLEEGQEKLGEGICPFFQEPCKNIADKPPGDVFSGKLADLDQKRQRLQAEIKTLEKEEAEANAASESIKAFEVQLKGLDEQEKSLAGKREANQKRSAGLESLKKEQDEAQKQVIEKQKVLGAYNRLQADIEVSEAEQKKHQASRDLFVANQEQAAKLESLQKDLKKFETLLTQLQDELAGKEDELKTAGKDYDADQHQALKLQKDTLRQEVGALGQKVEGLKADVERLTNEIDRLKQLEKEIAEKKAQIKAYGEKEELVKFLRNRVFNKVSAYLSERFREEISQRANRIYRIIAEVDEELAWGEDYRIVLRDMEDGELRERYDDQLSGGQTMSAVVALRLAMLQTIGARIAFFDEPTSNLDVTRRENLAHAFRAIDVGKEEVTEHWYDQLFLISHDVAFTEVKDQILVLE
ncbi:MAG: SMC family ATPase [Desulfuromonas sp.]|nr:MAG: SMC family ATPase [Desulfuromonas sp.]